MERFYDSDTNKKQFCILVRYNRQLLVSHNVVNTQQGISE